jgi:hypothetical protein
MITIWKDKNNVLDEGQSLGTRRRRFWKKNNKTPSNRLRSLRESFGALVTAGILKSVTIMGA